MKTGRRTTAPPAKPAGRSTRTGGDRGSSGEGRMGAMGRAVSHLIGRRAAALIAAAAIGLGAGDLPGSGVFGGAAVRASPAALLRAQGEVSPFREYRVPPGSHPHDVAPAPDGTVWYTAQTAGELGRLDPATGGIRHVKLGEGAAPHGVIVGPDGAPWVTDGGLNTIVRVAPGTGAIPRFSLTAARAAANLNTEALERRGILWFTGENGVYGRMKTATRHVGGLEDPGGRSEEQRAE